MGEFRTYLQAPLQEVLHGFDVTRTIDDFEPYQHWMVNAMLTKPRVLIGAFMGSGKTAAALQAFWQLRRKYGPAYKALVVAPYEVARNTWPDEIMVWDFARDLRYSVVMGDPVSRVGAVQADSDIYFINRENFAWLVKYVDTHMGGVWKWPLLIYDEASRLKGGKEKTDKGNLTEFGWVKFAETRFDRVWELTGTPSSNGWIDLWGPAYVLDRGLRLGATRTAFLNRWFRHNSYTQRYEPHDHSPEEISSRLRDVMFCLREEDYLDLPPLVLRDRFVTLKEEDREKYRKFEQTLIFDEFDIEATNAAVLVNKLLQFANGSVYDPGDELDTGPPVAQWVHDAKIAELDRVFAETGGLPVLIMYSYKFDLHRMKRKFPFIREYGRKANDLADWNAGKVRAMAMHPASAGHGLNFQHGGHIAVWYGLNWSLELYQQAMKRLHRRGQTADRVYVYRILAEETMDEVVAERLEQKGAVQDDIISAMLVRADEVRASVGMMNAGRLAPSSFI